MSDRPPRLRPLPAAVVEAAAQQAEGLPEAELLERLERALATLPQPERSAAVVAFGWDEGSAGVAEELGLDPDDAEALTRSALQLLRGALADVDLDEPTPHPRLPRRRKRRTEEPGEG